MNHAFSYFSAPVLNTRPAKRCGLREIYELIRSEKWAKRTERLRSLQSAVERREYKAYNLDFVTFSGVFRTRRNSALLEYSNLICIDIDHIGDEKEIREMQQRFVEDEYLMPQLIFRSPSGDGLKVVVRCDSKADHKKRHNSVIQYIERVYDVRPDNTPDVARACFLCYDPEAYYLESTEDRVQITDYRVQITDERVQRTDKRVQITDERVQSTDDGEQKLTPCSLFHVPYSLLPTPCSLSLTDYDRIDSIVRRIEHDQQDVTTPYRKWFRIGLALASIFGEDGRSLYHRISRFYDGYTPQETERQYYYCMRYTNHTTNIGTLIYLLNE